MMSELTKVRLRTLLWLPLPVIIVAVVPWLLVRSEASFLPERWGFWQWLGVWLIANGLGLSAWCVQLFNIEGRGTPLPLDPPRRFVATGPYRFVRNPMLLGMFLIVWGEAALVQSVRVAWYALALMVLGHLFVVRWEEPDLTRRFGESYREYRKAVPRWIPRPIPPAGGQL